MERVVFSRPADELSCIIGNLFCFLHPPCAPRDRTGLVLRGITHSQNPGELIIKSDHCIYFGERSDLDLVLNRVCIERRCANG
nr:MAG TPA: hypothetical protein [Caudoviricetes sp.]